MILTKSVTYSGGCKCQRALESVPAALGGGVTNKAWIGWSLSVDTLCDVTDVQAKVNTHIFSFGTHTNKLCICCLICGTVQHPVYPTDACIISQLCQCQTVQALVCYVLHNKQIVENPVELDARGVYTRCNIINLLTPTYFETLQLICSLCCVTFTSFTGYILFIQTSTAG